MRPILFHRLLPQHPILPTPESSSRLLFPYFGDFIRFFTASIAFAMRDRLGSLFFPFWLTFRCCKTCPELVEGFTLCYGLLLCSFFSKGYNASAHSVGQMHWLPATWPPDSYHDRTSSGEQTMAFQDTQAVVGLPKFSS